jgi:CRISPR-associated protein Csb2
MRLVLQQSFPLGRFHATPWRVNPFDDPYGEWPPSPWRLTRAIVARSYQWRRETAGAWPEDELESLIRALCSSDYRFYLPQQARQSVILRQYQPVEFGWNPAAKKAPGTKSYGTSLTQDNAWCVPPDEDLFWFVEGDGWTPRLVEVLDRCLERIVYFGRAEALTRICRTYEAPISANVTLSKNKTSSTLVPVLVPSPDATRTDIERVTQDPKAARNIPQGARLLYARRPQLRPAREVPRRAPTRPDAHLVQFALGWAVAPEQRATVRLTARFRTVVLRNLIRMKTKGAAVRWNDAPADVRDAIAGMTGKDSHGVPLRGPRAHAEFLLWWDGDVPTRLLVWRSARPFCRDEQEAILRAAAQELSWAAVGPDAEAWKIKLVPLDAAVVPPPGFDGTSATTWRTLTPYVLPRHHLRGGKIRESETIENQIRRELTARAYASSTKLLSVEEIEQPRWVAVHIPRREAESRSVIGDRRGYWLRLGFSQPIRGPIRLGHSSSFGLGLFAPVTS